MFKKVFCVWLLRSNQINTEHSVKQIYARFKMHREWWFREKIDSTKHLFQLHQRVVFKFIRKEKFILF